MRHSTINWQPEILEDELIKIIPLRSSDFEALFAIASDPLIWEQHPSYDRYKREVFQLYFDGALASQSAFLLIDKRSGQLIGSTRYYDFKAENSSIAIGYTFLARPYWGGRFNRSSKKLLLDYAFRYVENVFLHIGTNNIRSQKATLKLGAIRVNEVDFDYYGKKLAHYEYLIVKEKWEQSNSNGN